ncbi:hypothetical protein M1818_002860 [Neofusicoccum parvum]|nr:hypothetical protein M1818_002860 [Neofusicoccum parvum]
MELWAELTRASVAWSRFFYQHYSATCLGLTMNPLRLLVYSTTIALAVAAPTQCDDAPTGQPTVALDRASLPGSYGAITEPQDLLAVQQIQRTLNLYPFAIDGKQYDLLDEIFFPSAWSNYSALMGAFDSLPALKTGLRDILAKVNTQHGLTSQLIEVAKGGTTARTATYFSAMHFGTGAYAGQSVWAWGTYEDNWVRNSSTGEWKIVERTLDYPPGSLYGNTSIFY